MFVPPHEFFEQIRYKPIAEIKPKLMLAIKGEILDIEKTNNKF